MGTHGRGSARAARLRSTDARAVTTQRLLVDALVKVVRTEGFDHASATRVASEAGLSRSGFYEHFASVDELAFFVLDDLLAEATARDLRARAMPNTSRQALPQFALELLLNTILKDRELYEHILLSDRAGSIVGRVMERFGRSALPVVAAARPELSSVQQDLYAAAIGSGVFGVVIHCLRTGDQRSASELTREVVGIMPAWIYPERDSEKTGP